jgi:AAA15 family ATPase/GTPase
MLIDFTVKNYRSIKDEQHLSMVGTKQKEYIDTHTFEVLQSTSTRLLKTAAIYGANAAGKSNFIKALRAMQEIVIFSTSKYQRGDLLPIKPFLLDSTSVHEATAFEVNFISNGVRYQYGFSATQERIVEEWLIAYPKGRPQNWFARVLNTSTNEPTYDWQFGDKLTGQKQLWQESTRDNALFLSTAVNLNSEQLNPVFDWFDKILRITGVGGWSPKFTIELCKEDKHKEEILRFLRTADMDIEDIEIEKNLFTRNNDVPEGLAAMLANKETVKMWHSDEQGNKVALDLNEESDGTQKLFAFIGPWLDSLEKGHVLLIDELHDNFHPLMVKFLVELFHNSTTNKSNAQLIFTTHETSILSQDVFRRDQVWFCEKRDKATVLYSLVEFKARKGVTDLEKAYLSGRYGALPFFKDITMAMGN